VKHPAPNLPKAPSLWDGQVALFGTLGKVGEEIIGFQVLKKSLNRVFADERRRLNNGGQVR